MDPPGKMIMRSTGYCIVILGVIHTGWYFLREKFVPKEERRYTPIVALLEHFLEVDKDAKSKDTKAN